MRLTAGLHRPKRNIPGVDLAGTVESVGGNVTRFKPGDAVFGFGVGSCAEFAAAREDRLAPRPIELTFEQAAAIPVAAVTALQGLRDHGKVEAGQKVLINGAAGGVGTFAVQIAKALGAEVTGVCSTRNVDTIRSIGADHVIDYTKDDFVESGRRYDVMIDNVGNRSLSDCRKVLARDGVFVVIGGPKEGRLLGPIPRFIRTLVYFRFVSQKAVSYIARASGEELLHLRGFLESGQVVPVIERTYSLNEVPEAMRYLGTGHARGKLVINL
jgi:NADPH:quinone reductase-like Zn-dependent oxidoreductase